MLEPRSGGRMTFVGATHGISTRRMSYHRETAPREATPRETIPREARHIRNRLQANIVSAAGGKTAPCHSARRAPQSRMAAKGI